MRLILTAIIFAAGMLYLFMGIGFLIDPAASGADFGLSANNESGLAAMRADMTAFFVVSALCMLYGAWRRNGDVLLVPAALFAVALFGRFVSIFGDGTVDDFWQPMVIEALTVIVMLAGRRVLPHRDAPLEI